jgi:hypothetical protein
MEADSFMARPNGKVVGTLLTDAADLLFVEKTAEAEGRTVSNWLRKMIRDLRRQHEREQKPPSKGGR